MPMPCDARCRWLHTQKVMPVLCRLPVRVHAIERTGRHRAHRTALAGWKGYSIIAFLCYSTFKK